MFTRDNNYYGIVNDGLSYIGYTGATAFTQWVNDTFANKYNAQKTFKQIGFGIDPSLPLNPTYEQLELTVRPYTMGAYVDIDSDGPTKHTDGASLSMGKIPTFKHEITMTRKTMREQALLRQRLGRSDDAINETIIKEMFNGVDKLLGGNYNTIAYQRHQIVSTGSLIINAKNNPVGVPLKIDFLGAHRTAHTISNKAAYKLNDGVVEDATSAENSKNFLRNLRDLKRNAERKDFAPSGHWEVCYNTWQNILQIPAIRKLYATYAYPTANEDSQTVFGNLATDDVIRRFIEQQIGAGISVIDAVGTVEFWNSSEHKPDAKNYSAFKEGWMVYVPDGEIGTVQFAAPFYMDTPEAMTALYDGGRTLLRTLFESKTMSYSIGSEVTGLCVPSKTRWMYYFKVEEGATALDVFDDKEFTL